MRILAVNWRDLRNPAAGGAEVHLHEILKRMVERGHEATLVTSNFEGGRESETYDGLRVIRKGNWYNANFVIPFFVRRYLKEREFDLVVEDINKIPFFLPAFSRARVLAVVPHLFGGSVFRETNWILASYIYSWELFIPFVYQSCRFVAISPSTKEDLIDRGIPKDRIDVVLCGLDHSTYRLLSGVSRFEEPTIVHFGRMRRYKSIGTIIKAFRLLREKMKKARLLIIGEGPEKPNLVALAGKLRLEDSVSFLGALPTEELVQVLNRSHLFVNASTKEGWGLTVVEANACGLPVLASDRPGLRDSVKHGETGYLVEYGNERALADKASEILSDDSLWLKMSEAAVSWARTLTWEKTAEEMEKIFIKEIS